MSSPGDRLDYGVDDAHGLRVGDAGASGDLLGEFVYLGEDYVADVIVGLLIAEAVRRTEPLAALFVHAVARAVK